MRHTTFSPQYVGSTETRRSISRPPSATLIRPSWGTCLIAMSRLAITLIPEMIASREGELLGAGEDRHDPVLLGEWFRDERSELGRDVHGIERKPRQLELCGDSCGELLDRTDAGSVQRCRRQILLADQPHRDAA